MKAEKEEANKYIAYGFEQALIKLQKDYQESLAEVGENNVE